MHNFVCIIHTFLSLQLVPCHPHVIGNNQVDKDNLKGLLGTVFLVLGFYSPWIHLNQFLKQAVCEALHLWVIGYVLRIQLYGVLEKRHFCAVSSLFISA